MHRKLRPDDVGDIASMRDQLWAEAVHRYKDGEPWWVTDKALLHTVKARQEDARQHDEWEEILREKLYSRVSLTLTEAAALLGIKPDKLDKSIQTRLGYVMQTLQFKRKRETTGARQTYYARKV
jgi:predicted P-loop ATPase